MNDRISDSTVAQVKSPSRLLTIDEVAESLRKSPAQLRWMIHRGTAPKSALIGGRRLFRLVDVERFVSEAFEVEE